MITPLLFGLLGLLLQPAPLADSHGEPAAMSADPADLLVYDTLAEATAGESGVALWRLADADTTIYLMGTVHLLSQGVDWKTETIERALDEADTLILETDTAPSNVASLAPYILKRGFYRDGTKMSDFYTDEEAAQIDAGLRKIGLALPAINSMRPWYAGVTMGSAAIQRVGGRADAGIETILTGIAKREDMAIRFLETPREQIDVLADLDDATMARANLVGMPQIENARAYFSTMVGHWYHGDMDELGAMMLTAEPGLEALDEAVLFDRNDRWADILRTIIAEEDGVFFVGVGAGHLAGERSLIADLAARGLPPVRMGTNER